MAGTCLLAYGVVFVLLIGEIDLSIAFVSGIAGSGRRRARSRPDRGRPPVVRSASLLAILRARRRSARFQGSFVALIGVPSFVVTLAGFLIWQGVIQLELPGVIVIQDNMINNVVRLLLRRRAGWIIGDRRQRRVRRRGCSASCSRSAAARDRDPRPGPAAVLRLAVVPAIALRTVYDPATRTAACRSRSCSSSAMPRRADLPRQADDVRPARLRGRRERRGRAPSRDQRRRGSASSSS